MKFKYSVAGSYGFANALCPVSSYLRLGEGAVQQPCHDGQVATLIVRRQDDRVLVFRFGRHGGEIEWQTVEKEKDFVKA